MNEMLDIILRNSFLYVYGASIFFALFSYSKYFDSSLKYLPILLAYTFLNELLGSLIRQNPDFNPVISGFYASYTRVFYNIYVSIFILYFLFIYYNFFKNDNYKKIIKLLSISYIVSVIICLFFQDYMIEFQLYPTIYGSVILTYCSIQYLIKQPRTLRLKFAEESLLFWLSIGLLMFTLGVMPILIYNSTLDFQDKEVYFKLKRVHIIIVDVMYCCFIYGFIQMKGKLKSGH